MTEPLIFYKNSILINIENYFLKILHLSFLPKPLQNSFSFSVKTPPLFSVSSSSTASTKSFGPRIPELEKDIDEPVFQQVSGPP
jgi:hypothetical protein